MKTSVFVSDCLFWLFFVIYYSCFQHTVHILIFLQSLHDEENSVVISLWFGVELPLLMALLQYLIQQGKINGKWGILCSQRVIREDKNRQNMITFLSVSLTTLTLVEADLVLGCPANFKHLLMRLKLLTSAMRKHCKMGYIFFQCFVLCLVSFLLLQGKRFSANLTAGSCI